jgi:predicted Rossmann fold flavoprotein
VKEHQFDVVVLGAGAAGMMCAIEAGKRGRSVALLEHSDRPGKKILISGGGRCNFTNLHCRPENFLSGNPHFAKSALARYTPADFIRLVERYGIAYHEKTLGQLFCDRAASDITNLLEAECRAAGVAILVKTPVLEVTRDAQFLIRSESQAFRAPAVVVATGGLSIPKMGASALGYDLARQFGLAILAPRPALVPLVLSADEQRRYCDLAGVSADVQVSIGRQSFREKMLLTHRGLSGPAILQISSYWRESEPLTIDLAPGIDVTAGMRSSPAGRELPALRAALNKALAQRLATRWAQVHAPPNWTNQALLAFERQLHSWQVVPDGSEGYEKAEVTAGGVDTAELSAKTMESRKAPGLYFIGEVVDVTGQLGGFNFQWAWASGYCAGHAV